MDDEQPPPGGRGQVGVPGPHPRQGPLHHLLLRHQRRLELRGPDGSSRWRKRHVVEELNLICDEVN